jgi:hypothetical protein
MPVVCTGRRGRIIKVVLIVKGSTGVKGSATLYFVIEATSVSVNINCTFHL